MEYECQRLIDLYNEEKMEFIKGFHGFDVEYINNRVEDIVQELTGIEIIYQEPMFITKSADIGKQEPNRSDSWSDDDPIINQYGNRIFTFMIFLTPGELFFPNINLRHITKTGDGIIWNNVTKSGRTLDSINQVSNNTYYVKKWIREKPFI